MECIECSPLGNRLFNWAIPIDINSDSCMIEITQGVGQIEVNYLQSRKLYLILELQNFALMDWNSLGMDWTRIVF